MKRVIFLISHLLVVFSQPFPRDLKCDANHLYGSAGKEDPSRDRWLFVQVGQLTLESCVKACFEYRYCYSVRYDVRHPRPCGFYLHTSENCDQKQLKKIQDIRESSDIVIVECLKCGVTNNDGPEFGMNYIKRQNRAAIAFSSDAEDKVESTTALNPLESFAEIKDCYGTLNYRTSKLNKNIFASDTVSTVVGSPEACALTCLSISGCSSAIYIPEDGLCLFSKNNEVDCDGENTDKQNEMVDKSSPVQLNCIRCLKSARKVNEKASDSPLSEDFSVLDQQIFKRSCLVTYQVYSDPSELGFETDREASVNSVNECAFICYQNSCSGAIFEPPQGSSLGGKCKVAIRKKEKCDANLQRHYSFKTKQSVGLSCFRCVHERPTTVSPDSKLITSTISSLVPSGESESPKEDSTDFRDSIHLVQLSKGCTIHFQVDRLQSRPFKSDFEEKIEVETFDICATRCYQNGCTGALFNAEMKECKLGYEDSHVCSYGSLITHFIPTNPSESFWIHCVSCQTMVPRKNSLFAQKTSAKPLEISTTTIESIIAEVSKNTGSSLEKTTVIPEDKTPEETVNSTIETEKSIEAATVIPEEAESKVISPTTPPKSTTHGTEVESESKSDVSEEKEANATTSESLQTTEGEKETTESPVTVSTIESGEAKVSTQVSHFASASTTPKSMEEKHTGPSFAHDLESVTLTAEYVVGNTEENRQSTSTTERPKSVGVVLPSRKGSHEKEGSEEEEVKKIEDHEDEAPKKSKSKGDLENAPQKTELGQKTAFITEVSNAETSEAAEVESYRTTTLSGSTIEVSVIKVNNDSEQESTVSFAESTTEIINEVQNGTKEERSTRQPETGTEIPITTPADIEEQTTVSSIIEKVFSWFSTTPSAEEATKEAKTVKSSTRSEETTESGVASFTSTTSEQTSTVPVETLMPKQIEDVTNAEEETTQARQITDSTTEETTIEVSTKLLEEKTTLELPKPHVTDNSEQKKGSQPTKIEVGYSEKPESEITTVSSLEKSATSKELTEKTTPAETTVTPKKEKPTAEETAKPEVKGTTIKQKLTTQEAIEASPTVITMTEKNEFSNAEVQAEDKLQQTGDAAEPPESTTETVVQVTVKNAESQEKEEVTANKKVTETSQIPEREAEKVSQTPLSSQNEAEVEETTAGGVNGTTGRVEGRTTEGEAKTSTESSVEYTTESQKITSPESIVEEEKKTTIEAKEKAVTMSEKEATHGYSTPEVTTESSVRLTGTTVGLAVEIGVVKEATETIVSTVSEEKLETFQTTTEGKTSAKLGKENKDEDSTKPNQEENTTAANPRDDEAVTTSQPSEKAETVTGATESVEATTQGVSLGEVEESRTKSLTEKEIIVATTPEGPVRPKVIVSEQLEGENTVKKPVITTQEPAESTAGPRLAVVENVKSSTQIEKETSGVTIESVEAVTESDKEKSTATKVVESTTRSKEATAESVTPTTEIAKQIEGEVTSEEGFAIPTAAAKEATGSTVSSEAEKPTTEENENKTTESSVRKETSQERKTTKYGQEEVGKTTAGIEEQNISTQSGKSDQNTVAETSQKSYEEVRTTPAGVSTTTEKNIGEQERAEIIKVESKVTSDEEPQTTEETSKGQVITEGAKSPRMETTTEPREATNPTEATEKKDIDTATSAEHRATGPPESQQNGTGEPEFTTISGEGVVTVSAEEKETHTTVESTEEMSSSTPTSVTENKKVELNQDEGVKPNEKFKSSTPETNGATSEDSSESTQQSTEELIKTSTLAASQEKVATKVVPYTTTGSVAENVTTSEREQTTPSSVEQTTTKLSSIISTIGGWFLTTEAPSEENSKENVEIESTVSSVESFTIKEVSKLQYHPEQERVHNINQSEAGTLREIQTEETTLGSVTTEGIEKLKFSTGTSEENKTVVTTEEMTEPISEARTTVIVDIGKSVITTLLPTFKEFKNMENIEVTTIGEITEGKTGSTSTAKAVEQSSTTSESTLAPTTSDVLQSQDNEADAVTLGDENISATTKSEIESSTNTEADGLTKHDSDFTATKVKEEKTDVVTELLTIEVTNGPVRATEATIQATSAEIELKTGEATTKIPSEAIKKTTEGPETTKSTVILSVEQTLSSTGSSAQTTKGQEEKVEAATIFGLHEKVVSVTETVEESIKQSEIAEVTSTESSTQSDGVTSSKPKTSTVEKEEEVTVIVKAEQPLLLNQSSGTEVLKLKESEEISTTERTEGETTAAPNIEAQADLEAEVFTTSGPVTTEAPVKSTLKSERESAETRNPKEKITKSEETVKETTEHLEKFTQSEEITTITPEATSGKEEGATIIEVPTTAGGSGNINELTTSSIKVESQANHEAVTKSSVESEGAVETTKIQEKNTASPYTVSSGETTTGSQNVTQNEVSTVAGIEVTPVSENEKTTRLPEEVRTTEASKEAAEETTKSPEIQTPSNSQKESSTESPTVTTTGSQSVTQNEVSTVAGIEEITTIAPEATSEKEVKTNIIDETFLLNRTNGNEVLKLKEIEVTSSTVVTSEIEGGITTSSSTDHIEFQEKETEKTETVSEAAVKTEATTKIRVLQVTTNGPETTVTPVKFITIKAEEKKTENAMAPTTEISVTIEKVDSTTQEGRIYNHKEGMEITASAEAESTLLPEVSEQKKNTENVGHSFQTSTTQAEATTETLEVEKVTKNAETQNTEVSEETTELPKNTAEESEPEIKEDHKPEEVAAEGTGRTTVGNAEVITQEATTSARTEKENTSTEVEKTTEASERQKTTKLATSGAGQHTTVETSEITTQKSVGEITRKEETISTTQQEWAVESSTHSIEDQGDKITTVVTEESLVRTEDVLDHKEKETPAAIGTTEGIETQKTTVIESSTLTEKVTTGETKGRSKATTEEGVTEGKTKVTTTESTAESPEIEAQEENTIQSVEVTTVKPSEATISSKKLTGQTTAEGIEAPTKTSELSTLSKVEKTIEPHPSKTEGTTVTQELSEETTVAEAVTTSPSGHIIVYDKGFSREQTSRSEEEIRTTVSAPENEQLTTKSNGETRERTTVETKEGTTAFAISGETTTEPITVTAEGIILASSEKLLGTEISLGEDQQTTTQSEKNIVTKESEVITKSEISVTQASATTSARFETSEPPAPSESSGSTSASLKPIVFPVEHTEKNFPTTEAAESTSLLNIEKTATKKNEEETKTTEKSEEPMTTVREVVEATTHGVDEANEIVHSTYEGLEETTETSKASESPFKTATHKNLEGENKGPEATTNAEVEISQPTLTSHGRVTEKITVEGALVIGEDKSGENEGLTTELPTTQGESAHERLTGSTAQPENSILKSEIEERTTESRIETTSLTSNTPGLERVKSEELLEEAEATTVSIEAGASTESVKENVTTENTTLGTGVRKETETTSPATSVISSTISVPKVEEQLQGKKETVEVTIAEQGTTVSTGGTQESEKVTSEAIVVVTEEEKKGQKEETEKTEPDATTEVTTDTSTVASEATTVATSESLEDKSTTVTPLHATSLSAEVMHPSTIHIENQKDEKTSWLSVEATTTGVGTEIMKIGHEETTQKSVMEGESVGATTEGVITGHKSTTKAHEGTSEVPIKSTESVKETKLTTEPLAAYTLGAESEETSNVETESSTKHEIQSHKDWKPTTVVHANAEITRESSTFEKLETSTKPSEEEIHKIINDDVEAERKPENDTSESTTETFILKGPQLTAKSIEEVHQTTSESTTGQTKADVTKNKEIVTKHHKEASSSITESTLHPFEPTVSEATESSVKATEESELEVTSRSGATTESPELTTLEKVLRGFTKSLHSETTTSELEEENLSNQTKAETNEKKATTESVTEVSPITRPPSEEDKETAETPELKKVTTESTVLSTSHLLVTILSSELSSSTQQTPTIIVFNKTIQESPKTIQSTTEFFAETKYESIETTTEDNGIVKAVSELVDVLGTQETTLEPPVQAVSELVETLSNQKNVEAIIRDQPSLGCDDNGIYFTAKPLEDYSQTFELVLASNSIRTCVKSCLELKCSKAAFTRFPRSACLLHFEDGNPLLSTCEGSKLHHTWRLTKFDEVVDITCIQCGEDRQKDGAVKEDALFTDSEFTPIIKRQGFTNKCNGRVEFKLVAVNKLPKLNVTNDVAADTPADCAQKCFETEGCTTAGFVPISHTQTGQGVCLTTSDQIRCLDLVEYTPQHASTVPFVISCIRCTKCDYQLTQLTSTNHPSFFDKKTTTNSVSDCAEYCNKHNCKSAEFDPASSICSLSINFPEAAKCPRNEIALEVNGIFPVRLDCVKCF